MVNSLDTFVAGAVEHGRYTIQGQSRKTNAAYRKLHRAREAMRAQEDGGEAALLAMLNHPDPSVRAWAALYLLPSNESAALLALDDIGKGVGLIALGARTTALEWRAGRLKVG